MAEKRKRVWIDGFQTALAVRIIIYFVLYQALVWFSVILLRSVSVSLDAALGPAAIYPLFLLGSSVVFIGILFIYDAVHFTHRIVGPIHRMRKTIKAIAAGEDLELVTLRKGDMLQDLKDEVNEMLRALEQRGVLKMIEKKQA